MAAIDFSRTASTGQLVGGRIINAISNYATFYGDWKAAQATRKELGSLSDHELADIGLCRGDIDAISNGAKF